MAALANELARDPRPFRELSPEERTARLEKIMGVGRGLMSTSEEFAHQKLEEIELEEQKLVRCRYTLEELVKKITPENRHEETDFGPPVGREIL